MKRVFFFPTQIPCGYELLLLYNQRLVKFADGKFHFAGKHQSPITYTMNYSELPTLPDRPNCSYSGPTRVTALVTGPESLCTNCVICCHKENVQLRHSNIFSWVLIIVVNPLSDDDLQIGFFTSVFNKIGLMWDQTLKYRKKITQH